MVRLPRDHKTENVPSLPNIEDGLNLILEHNRGDIAGICVKTVEHTFEVDKHLRKTLLKS